MEYRRFGKQPRQRNELTATQAEKVVSGICRRGDGDAVRHIIEQRVLKAPRVAAQCTSGAMLSTLVTCLEMEADEAWPKLRQFILKITLGRLAVRGGIVSLAMQYDNGVLQLAATIVLARLLAPEDFGLVAIVTVLTSFALFLIDFGFGDATTQRAKITQSQVTVFLAEQRH